MSKVLPYKQIKIGDFIYILYAGKPRPVLVMGKLAKKEQLMIAFLEYNKGLEPRWAVPLLLKDAIKRISEVNLSHATYLIELLGHLGQLNTYSVINLHKDYIVKKLTAKEKFNYTSTLIYN